MLCLSRSHLGRGFLPSVVDDLVRELVPKNVAVLKGDEVATILGIEFDDDAVEEFVFRGPPNPKVSRDGGLPSGTGVPATLRLGRCLGLANFACRKGDERDEE